MTEPRHTPPGADPFTGAPPPASAPPPAGAAPPLDSEPASSSDRSLPEEKAANQSLGDLLSEVSGDISTLVHQEMELAKDLMRQEVELAKAEVRESATKAGKGAGLLGGAAIGGYMVILFLSLALWVGIANLIGSLAWSAVIVAVIWAIIAAVLAAMGKKELKSVKGVPQTTETAKEIPETLK